MSISRRNFCSLFAAALAPAGLAQEAKQAESKAAGPAPVLPSAALPYEQLPVRKTQAGESRALMKGKLATGEELEMHITTLEPGKMPHAGHAHVFTEIWLIREGMVEWTVKDKVTRLGPGSVAIAASNEFHSIKNVGDAPANYFVVAVGPGAFR